MYRILLKTFFERIQKITLPRRIEKNLVACELVDEVIAMEEKLLDQYKKEAEQYIGRFAEYGVVLRVYLGWKNTISNTLYDERPVIEKGYSAFVCCTVYDKNGVIIESEDHDEYMDFACMISSYVHSRNQVGVDIDSEIEKEDFCETLDGCIHFFKNPH